MPGSPQNFTVSVFKGESSIRKIRCSASSFLQKLSKYVSSRGFDENCAKLTLEGGSSDIRIGRMLSGEFADVDIDDVEEMRNEGGTIVVCLQEEVPVCLGGSAFHLSLNSGQSQTGDRTAAAQATDLDRTMVAEDCMVQSAENNRPALNTAAFPCATPSEDVRADAAASGDDNECLVASIVASGSVGETNESDGAGDTGEDANYTTDVSSDQATPSVRTDAAIVGETKESNGAGAANVKSAALTPGAHIEAIRVPSLPLDDATPSLRTDAAIVGETNESDGAGDAREDANDSADVSSDQQLDQPGVPYGSGDSVTDAIIEDVMNAVKDAHHLPQELRDEPSTSVNQEPNRPITLADNHSDSDESEYSASSDSDRSDSDTDSDEDLFSLIKTPLEDTNRVCAQWRYNVDPATVDCPTMRAHCQTPDRDLLNVPAIIKAGLDGLKYASALKHFTKRGLYLAKRHDGKYAHRYNCAKRRVFTACTKYIEKKMPGGIRQRNTQMMGNSIWYHFQWLRERHWSAQGSVQPPCHFLCSKTNDYRGQFTAFVWRYTTALNKTVNEKREMRKKKKKRPPPLPTAITAAEMLRDNRGMQSAVDKLKALILLRETRELTQMELSQEVQLMEYTFVYRRTLYDSDEEYWTMAQQLNVFGSALLNRKILLDEFQRMREHYPKYKSLGPEYNQEGFKYILSRCFAFVYAFYSNKSDLSPACSLLGSAPVVVNGNRQISLDDLLSMRLGDFSARGIQLVAFYCRLDDTDVLFNKHIVKSVVVCAKEPGAEGAIAACSEVHGTNFKHKVLLTFQTETGDFSSPIVNSVSSIYLVAQGHATRCDTVEDAIHDLFCVHWIYDTDYCRELRHFYSLLEMCYGCQKVVGEKGGPLAKKKLSKHGNKLEISICENDAAVANQTNRPRRLKIHDNLRVHHDSPKCPAAFLRSGMVLPNKALIRGPKPNEEMVDTHFHPASLHAERRRVRPQVTLQQQNNVHTRVNWRDKPQLVTPAAAESEESVATGTGTAKRRRGPGKKLAVNKLPAAKKQKSKNPKPEQQKESKRGRVARDYESDENESPNGSDSDARSARSRSRSLLRATPKTGFKTPLAPVVRNGIKETPRVHHSSGACGDSETPNMTSSSEYRAAHRHGYNRLSQPRGTYGRDAPDYDQLQRDSEKAYAEKQSGRSTQSSPEDVDMTIKRRSDPVKRKKAKTETNSWRGPNPDLSLPRRSDSYDTSDMSSTQGDLTWGGPSYTCL